MDFTADVNITDKYLVNDNNVCVVTLYFVTNFAILEAFKIVALSGIENLQHILLL